MPAAAPARHQRHRHRHLHALLLWGLFAAAPGADFYVSNTGHDSSSGAALSPWLTLQHAANLVRAGDTVHVAAGGYAGFELTTSGTVGAGIAFLGQSGASITSANTAGNGTDGIDIEGASFITISGFTVNSMPRSGITCRLNTTCTISGNSCDSNHTWGIFTSHSDHLLIQGNACSRSVQQHGIYVSNACVDPVVQGNTCFDNAGLGIHLNGDLSQGGSGVISGAVVDGNTVYGNIDNGIDGDGVIDSTYENNLCYGNQGNGISLFQIDGAQGPTGDVLVNNTIVVPANGRWGIAMQNMGGGNQIFNNILLNANPQHGSINADSPSGFLSDCNIVVSAFSTDYHDAITLGQWRSQTGQDQRSFLATAASLFVDPANDTYALLATAPAIDAGTATDAPDHDIIGTARPQGPGIDIGAYEFSTTAVSTGAAAASGGSTSTGTTSSSATAGSTTGSPATAGSAGSAGGGGGAGHCGMGGGLALLGVLLLRRQAMRRPR